MNIQRLLYYFRNSKPSNFHFGTDTHFSLQGTRAPFRLLVFTVLCSSECSLRLLLTFFFVVNFPPTAIRQQLEIPLRILKINILSRKYDINHNIYSPLTPPYFSYYVKARGPLQRTSVPSRRTFCSWGLLVFFFFCMKCRIIIVISPPFTPECQSSLMAFLI